MDGFDPKQAARNKHRASQHKKRGRGRPRGSGRGRPQGDRTTKESGRPSLDQYIHLPGDEDNGPSLDRMEQDAPPDFSKNWEYLLSMAGSPVQQELKYQEEKIWDQYNEEGQAIGGQGLDHLVKCLSTLPLSHLLDLDLEEDASLLTLLSSSEPPAPKRDSISPVTSTTAEEALVSNLIQQRPKQADRMPPQMVERATKTVPQSQAEPHNPVPPTEEKQSNNIEDNEDDMLDDLLSQPSGKSIGVESVETKYTETSNGDGEEEDLEDWLDSVL